MEEVVDAPSLGFRKTSSSSLKTGNLKITRLSDEVLSVHVPRSTIGIPELDRVLGGGLVKGSFVLISGDPGIGKSTLLLQAVGGLAKAGSRVLYVSGEESADQIVMRAGRLNVRESQVLVANESNIDLIIGSIHEHKPQVVVVDSIQTVFSPDTPSAPGSVTQVRECAAKLLDVAKREEIAIWLVGHVTKEGTIAGPRVLEHLVDCVLYLEGEAQSGHRILRSVKNRFGSTGEIGVFDMNELGLVSVENPGSRFLEHFKNTGKRIAGISTTVIMEGSRPLLVEIQSLVTKTNFGNPRRVVNGLDYNRVQTTLAVLEKRSSLNLSFNDVYMSVAGGLKLTEPANDLAVAVSVASSHLERPVIARSAFIGELSLTGLLRPCTHLQQRIQEATKLGYDRVFVPALGMKDLVKQPRGIEICPVDSISNIESFLV